jgi:predicted ribosome quality control (RQC) complex YloA/Tae2 family protein
VHNNYYFLRQVSQSLNRLLDKAAISECFSQNKNELIVRFETRDGSFFIRASLQSSFSSVSFMHEFNRARKNSVDLFSVLLGQRVMRVRQFNNERSFGIELTNNYSLIFKMHASRSNVIVFEKDKAVDLFNKNLVADRSISPNSLDREIDWSLEAFRANENNLQQHYFTFGKIVWQYLASKNSASMSTEEKWDQTQKLRSQLEDPTFVISLIKGTPHIVLFEFGDVIKRIDDPLRAANEFFYTYTQEYALSQERNQLLSLLRSIIKNGENYIAKNRGRLNDIRANHDYKTLADLIMANMHAIQPSMEKIIVENFYGNSEPIEIKLKKGLSPQKNAEILYRKGKNQHLEIEQLEESIARKEQEIERTKSQIGKVETFSDLTSIRQAASAFKKSEKENQPEGLPYHEFEKSGFRIWVGKNAESNDKLTLKLSHKEDLWLHAKDVSGSHVLIKHQSGKNFPKEVIERAAELAAYNSKRKTETLAPVVYTQKKYVRKRKGDPAGLVVVERENVIMVEPRL